MTKHLDKKLEKALTDIKECVKLGTLGKQAYYNQFQTAIEIYLNNFNLFNGNITPLKTILTPLGKHRLLMVQYIKKVSNIDSLIVSKEGKLSIKIKKGESFTLNTDLLKNCKWYDSEIKADKSPLILNDDTFIKSLLTIFNKYKKESVTALNNKDIKLKKLDNLIKACK